MTTKDTVKPSDLIGGFKADSGKDRMDLIPPEAVFAYARILSFGAAKYSDRNWEKGMNWSRCFAAGMRHLWAWWGGAAPTGRNFMLGSQDDETKYSHLWHALFCVAALVTYEEREMRSFDDRWKGAGDPPKAPVDLTDQNFRLPERKSPYTRDEIDRRSREFIGNWSECITDEQKQGWTARKDLINSVLAKHRVFSVGDIPDSKLPAYASDLFNAFATYAEVQSCAAE